MKNADYPNTSLRSRSTAISFLRLVSFGYFLFAAVWWTAVLAPIDAPARWLLDLLDWPIDGGHATLARDTRFLSGIGAGLTVALGLMFLTIVIPGLQAGSKVVWKGALVSLSAWFVVDSLGNVLSGVPSNAVFNVVLYAMAAVPLWFAKPVAESHL